MHEKEGPNNQLHLNSDSKEMINYFKTVYIYVKFIELLKKNVDSVNFKHNKIYEILMFQINFGRNKNKCTNLLNLQYSEDYILILKSWYN